MIESGPGPTCCSALRRLGFRFLAAYVLLFNLGAVLGLIPGLGWLVAGGLNLWQRIVSRVTQVAFHSSNPISGEYTGSGDRLFEWLKVLDKLLIALVVAAIWTAFDRNRRHDRRVREVMRVVLRYVLGSTMLFYGTIKILHLQMPAPNASRLLESYWQSSPLGLLWTFMGFSSVYSAYIGTAEAGAGLLLFFRRTTGLGALLAATLTFNILVINLCFDVPVKLYAAHLFAFSVVLAAPELRALWDLLVVHRATAALPYSRPEVHPRASRYVTTAKLLFIGWLISSIAGTRIWDSLTKPPVAPAPISGLYEVTDLKLSTPEDRSLRWHWVFFEDGDVVIQTLDDQEHYSAQFGPEPGQITLLQDNIRCTFSYARQPSGQLLIEGAINGRRLKATLKPADDRQLLLVSQGFHWVTDQPLNR
jgi:hypothetical protein